MGSVKHSKQSAKSDGGDSTLVRPSDWNQDHVITLTPADIGAEPTGNLANHAADSTGVHGVANMTDLITRAEADALYGGGTTVMKIVLPFTQEGNVSEGAGVNKIYNDSGITLNIDEARAAVTTSPSGQDLIFDININGTSIWPSTQNNRLKVVAGQLTGFTSVFQTGTIADGQYFTVDVDQVGSTVPGADITVTIWLSGAVAGGLTIGAPAAADYIVATPHAGLTNEIPAGATPGGELAGTGTSWASPKVTPTHSGSSHAAAQAAAEAAAAAALAGHAGDPTGVHGITDTAALASTATKLDDFATPDDNTDLNASSSRHGLAPKLSGVVTEFLNGLGGFSTPAGGGGGGSDLGLILANEAPYNVPKDGTPTNGGTATDCRVAIQTAIDAAAAMAVPGAVWLDPGAVYWIKSVDGSNRGLTIPSHVRLMSAGYTETLTPADGTVIKAQIAMSSLVELIGDGAKLTGLDMDGNNLADITTFINAAQECMLRQVGIKRGRLYGLDSTGANRSSIEGFTVWNDPALAGQTSARFSGPDWEIASGRIKGGRVYNAEFQGSGSQISNLHLTGSGSLTIANTHIDAAWQKMSNLFFDTTGLNLPMVVITSGVANEFVSPHFLYGQNMSHLVAHTAGAGSFTMMGGDAFGTSGASLTYGFKTRDSDKIVGPRGSPVSGWIDPASGAQPVLLILTNADVLSLANSSTRVFQTFSRAGTIGVATGTQRIYNRTGRTLTLTSVSASVATAPTGQSILIDVNKNGTTIFTTQSNRPTIAAATNEDVSGTPQVAAWADGEYLTVDIDQVGTPTPGADLTVSIYVTG